MAVGLLVEIPEMTHEQYDAAVAAGGLENSLPPGQIFHVAGPIDGGWQVIDVWETRADFDRFAEETLKPAMGGQAPAPKQFPVHAFRK